MTACEKFSRKLLISLNSMTATAGIAAIVGGIIIKINIFGFINNLPMGSVAAESAIAFLQTAPIIVIVIGSFILLVSISGCYGAQWKNTVLLKVYKFFLLVILVGLMALAGFIFAHQGTIKSTMNEILEIRSNLYSKDDQNCNLLIFKELQKLWSRKKENMKTCVNTTLGNLQLCEFCSDSANLATAYSQNKQNCDRILKITLSLSHDVPYIQRIHSDLVLVFMKSYRQTAEFMDVIQTQFHCCGVYSSRDWEKTEMWNVTAVERAAKSEMLLGKAPVPDSCCVHFKTTGCGLDHSYNDTMTEIYEKGCSEVVWGVLSANGSVIGLIGIIVGALLLLCVFLTCSVIALVKDTQKPYD